jgi:ammonia channel protein AmtB
MMAVSDVLRAWEACSKTDTAFILVCSVFCWPIIPAVGLGYSGYSTRRSGLASFMPAILSIGCCTVQWWIIGYAIAYGDGNGIMGNLKYAFHRGVLAEPKGTIPAILFSEFQLIFCATVCAISVGGACERGRILPLIPFIFVSLPYPPVLIWLCLRIDKAGIIYSSGPRLFIVLLPIWSGLKQDFWGS